MTTKRRRDVDILTPAELVRLAAKMPAKLRASVLRVRRAVTYRAGQSHVGEPKTSAGVRDVAIPPHIRPMLKAHMKKHVERAADSLLFPADDGKHMRDHNYRTHWNKARKSDRQATSARARSATRRRSAGRPIRRDHSRTHVQARPHHTGDGAALSARRRGARRRDCRAAVEAGCGEVAGGSLPFQSCVKSSTFANVRNRFGCSEIGTAAPALSCRC